MLDVAALEDLVGAKRSTIYGWIQQKKFVAPVRLSAKSSRWVASEVEAWLDAKARARESSVTPAVTGPVQQKEAA
jgi:prophage regulatory protein